MSVCFVCAGTREKDDNVDRALHRRAHVRKERQVGGISRRRSIVEYQWGDRK